MPMNRRNFLKKTAAIAATIAIPYAAPRHAKAAILNKSVPPLPPAGPVPGPFQPSWDSLAQYSCPEWFRDAKFGIWAHWSAQCVPEQGDWYARGMYEQENPEPWSAGQYDYQCKHYGHPSKVGFKDVDHLWHAENWQPDRLIDLYHRAGAQYFVALANHHDNFDTWNSKYQPWNSVNIGPKKDIIGIWKNAARSRGMHFGVTVHAGRTWGWFDVSHGADKHGPLAGVPYDGNRTLADGVGTWWEGYDPAELYGPAGAARTDEAEARYELKLYNRVMDLLDQHHPDLLYFDDWEPPTRYSLQIAANYYNKSIQWNNGNNQAVLTCKNPAGHVKRSMVLDYERGSSSHIAGYPWQTDTCIGSWHYKRSLYENHQYKTPNEVVRMMVDIISKNGTFLLNIPLRGDGTIDPDEEAFLAGFTKWMDVNRESIFATRPWKISGEGPNSGGSGGAFSEGGTNALREHDFRFVTKGNTLYATSFAWPTSGKFVIQTLASGAAGIVGDVIAVTMLGVPGILKAQRTSAGLEVNVPDNPPCDHAWALRIEGLNLSASDPSLQHPPSTISSTTGSAITLLAKDAQLNGSLSLQGSGSTQNVGFWDDPTDSLSWRVQFDKAGTYRVDIRAAAHTGATRPEIDVNGAQTLAVDVPDTGDWNTFQTLHAGSITIASPGVHTVTVRPANRATWQPMNLAEVDLTPA